MKLARAIDPFSQAVAVTLAAVFCVIWAARTRSQAGTMVAGGAALFAALSWVRLSDSDPVLYNDADFPGSGMWWGPDGDGPNVLQDGAGMVAGLVELDNRPGERFRIAPGTNAYVTRSGDVKSYSPLSAGLNGWKEQKKTA